MNQSDMRQMIGQMIMVGFPDAAPNEGSPVVRAIRDSSLGGAGAIVRPFSLEEACVPAVNAGVDILLASDNTPEGHDPRLFQLMHEALTRALRLGPISPTAIQTANARIKALKEKMN